jgi:hypothetical protein
VALWTGIEVANFNFVIDMSGSDPRRGGSGYVAVNSVIINVAGCLGGLASGLIAERLKHWAWQPWAGGKVLTFYDVLFALSGAVRLAALVVLLPLIHEPSARGTLEALRFMRATILGAAQATLTRLSRAARLPAAGEWARELQEA